MKNVFRIVFIFLILLSFLGCKKKSQEISSSIKKEPTIQKTIIRFSIFGDQNKFNSLKKNIENFEQLNPDIQVKIDYWPENYYKNLNKSIISVKIPDVIMIDNIEGFSYYERGFLQNLNQYFLKKDNYIKSSISSFSYNDCIWGVPIFISPSFIIYNKNLFIKNNTEMPTLNWNIEDFVKKAHALNSSSIFGFGFEKKIYFWLPFLWINGGGIIDESGCIMLDSAISKESLQFYSNLKNLEGVTQQDIEISSEVLFRNGKIAMIIGDYEIFSKLKAEKLPFEIGIAPFPNAKTFSTSSIKVTGLGLSQKSKHKRESWRLILYLTNSDRIKKMSKDFDFLSPENTCIINTLSLRHSDEEILILQNIIKNAKPIPICSNYTIIINKIEQQIIPLFNAEKNVDEVIDENFYNTLQKYIK